MNPSEVSEIKAKVAEPEKQKKHLLQEVPSRDEVLAIAVEGNAMVKEAITNTMSTFRD